ncbi:MAG: hypothetical protein V3U89_08890 [Methylophilaceae bacterium]
MSLFKALFTHAWLAMRLKHDGTGLPVNFLGALLLASIYIALIMVNKSINNALTIESIIGLIFIGQFYLFSIRNTVIGLVILIGIIGNLFSMGMAAFGDVSVLQVGLLSAMEFLMIFGALINVIKTHSSML